VDKSYTLERQMHTLARIGQEFYSTLEEAQRRGLQREFLADASALINQLSGGPDAGAIQAMRDADRDVAATIQFIDKWSEYDGRNGYREVLQAARRTLQALSEFRNTVNRLTSRERAEIKAQARMGRLAGGKGCSVVILIVFILISGAILSVFMVDF